MKIAMVDSIGGQGEIAWIGDVAPTLKQTHYKTLPSLRSIVVDLWNHNLTGDVSMALQSARADPHHLPCVIVWSEK